MAEEETVNHATQKSVRDRAVQKIWPKIEAFFQDNETFEREVREYWEVWNASKSSLTYEGIHDVVVPVSHDAIETCVKRDMGVFFPVSNTWVDVTGDSWEDANEVKARVNTLLFDNDFMGTMRLGTRTARVTGTLILYVDWVKEKGKVLEVVHEGEDGMPLAEPEVREKEKFVKDYPVFRVVSPTDFIILPVTAQKIRDAWLCGERRFLSEHEFREMMDDGTFVKDRNFLSALLHTPKEATVYDAKSHGIGIKRSAGGDKTIGVVDVFTDFDLGEGPEPALLTFSQSILLRAVKNPFWSKKKPYFSTPKMRDGETFFGHGDIQYIADFNDAANDYANQGLDSGTYALNPMIAVDPALAPNYKSFVIGPGMIWTGGNPTPMTFPNLAPEAMGLIQQLKTQVMETAGIMPPSPQNNGRRAPAAVAAMQSAEIQMAEQDWARAVETDILVPVSQWVFELDRQFRETDLFYTQSDMKLAVIEPKLHTGNFRFTWLGSRQAMNPQKAQQVMTALNILGKLPPQLLGDKKLDLVPLLEYLLGSVFSLPHMDRVLKSQGETYNPMLENLALDKEVDLPVHEADNDLEHIHIHAEISTHATLKHIQLHMKQLEAKTNAQQQQMAGKINQSPQAPAPPKGPAPVGPGGHGPMRPPGNAAPTGKPQGMSPVDPTQQMAQNMPQG